MHKPLLTIWRITRSLKNLLQIIIIIFIISKSHRFSTLSLHNQLPKLKFFIQIVMLVALAVYSISSSSSSSSSSKISSGSSKISSGSNSSSSNNRSKFSHNLSMIHKFSNSINIKISKSII